LAEVAAQPVTQAKVALVVPTAQVGVAAVVPIEITAPRAAVVVPDYLDKAVTVQRAVPYHWDNLAVLAAAAETMLLDVMAALLAVLVVQAMKYMDGVQPATEEDWYI
jgi:hypothetical protein